MYVYIYIHTRAPKVVAILRAVPSKGGANIF